MTYTSKQVNKWYKIKVFGKTENGKVNTLVGFSGLVNMIGEELADKLIKRAFDKADDKCECRLRRGLKVTFYSF